jgi:septum formation protein
MTAWIPKEPLLLASASPTRRQLLEKAGLPIEIAVPRIDERSLEASAGIDDRSEVALLLARAKALEVSQRHDGRLVVGADQTLSCGARKFHKPSSPAEAIEHLSLLTGRTHHLHSAAALVRNGQVIATVTDDATLTMRSMSREEISRYVDAAGSGATSSVGCYQVEGMGIHLFDSIEGSHFTILGIPLLPLLREFRRLELIK